MTHAALMSQLFGATHGEISHGFFYHILIADAFTGKAPAGADTLLLRQFLDADAAFAIQFLPRSHRGDVEMTAHPTFFLICKLGSSSDAHIIEFPGNLSSDSPYIFYREQRQSLVSPFIRINETAALIALVFLGEFGTDFR